MKSTHLAGIAILAGLCSLSAAADRQEVETIKPSAADPRITQYDEPNVVIVNADAGPSAPLVVFLPGTGGRPQPASPLLQVIAAQGYRVISLSYDDVPSVSQVCPRDPDPSCSTTFRQMRSFGDGSGPVANPPAESIVSRLTTLLAYLDRQHPSDGWRAYLEDGKPAWDRIVLTGLSQGAGMAAFIAKQIAVRRVVLFSSPWDTTGSDRRPAPWLSTPSATPMDRWWAERHAREATTDLIAQAYAALAIPADQVLVFDRSLATEPRGASNPFHGSTIRDAGYAPQWRRMFGEVGR